MKAITLWQPWASAMARGHKQNETRSWPLSHRGDLVICSAKRKPSLIECGDRPTYDAAMKLPYGFALCVVEIYDVVRSEAFHGATPLKISQQEAELGDYSPGRFIWLTRHLRVFNEPIPVTGRQGLFELPDVIIDAAVDNNKR